MAPAARNGKAERKISKLYGIIKFGNDTVELVPTNWIIDGRICLWPPNRTNSQIMTMVKALTEPGEEQLQKRKKNLRDAEYTSHLDTETSEDEEEEAGLIQPAKKRMQLPPPPKSVIEVPTPPSAEGSQGSSCSSQDTPSPVHRSQGRSCSSKDVPSIDHLQSPRARSPYTSHGSSQEARSPVQYGLPRVTIANSQVGEGADVDLSAFMKKSLRLLLEIKGDIRDLTRRVAALEQGSAPPSSGDSTADVDDILEKPLSTVEQWDILEDKLQDSVLRKNLVDRLAVHGGSTLNDVVRLIMEACTRKSLQQLMTVEGVTEKRRLKARAFLLVS
ncbi:uncharacterized protein LOC135392388 [Ornithodoros turicata]|uniref:uncharacterized protein LOC135392388 n=1 Tax=Ornithodoros turicata TaxID=34597 RepID=UPI003138CCD3